MCVGRGIGGGKVAEEECTLLLPMVVVVMVSRGKVEGVSNVCCSSTLRT